MTPELKTEWVDALKSGEYIQVEGALKGESMCDVGQGLFKFCCLGVLRHIVDPEDTRAALEFLTDEQLAEYGLEADDATELSIMNDNGITFTEIAELIQTGIRA